jgi:hypothetical protein
MRIFVHSPLLRTGGSASGNWNMQSVKYLEASEGLLSLKIP